MLVFHAAVSEEDDSDAGYALVRFHVQALRVGYVEHIKILLAVARATQEHDPHETISSTMPLEVGYIFRPSSTSKRREMIKFKASWKRYNSHGECSSQLCHRHETCRTCLRMQLTDKK